MKFCKLNLLIICTFCFISCGNTKLQTTKNTTSLVLKLAETRALGNPATDGDIYFAELVMQRTKGRIRIEVLPNYNVEKENTIVERVKYGNLDFARVSNTTLASYRPDYYVLSYPFLYKNGQHQWNTLDGKIGKIFLDELVDIGLIGLCYYDAGVRSFYSKDKLFSIQDFRKYPNITKDTSITNDFLDEPKIIACYKSPSVEAFIRNLGASPKEMTTQQVLTAFQNNQIDGAEGTQTTYFYSKHCDYAPYFCVDEHTRAPDILIASRIVMEQMSNDDFYLIKTCAKDAAIYQRQRWLEFEAATFLRLKNRKDIFQVYMSDSSMKLLMQAADDALSTLTVRQRDLLYKIKAIATY